MFCPKCGTFNDNENIWCINCGHGKLPTISEKPQTTPQAGISDRQQSEVQTAAEVMQAAFTEKNSATNTSENSNLHIEDNPKSDVFSSNGVKPASSYGCKWKVNKKEIKDYFVWAILAAVLCSITFGVAAIIFSAMTKAEKAAGNMIKAQVYSSRTKMFAIIALIVGTIKYIFAFLLISVVAAGVLLPFYPYYF